MASLAVVVLLTASGVYAWGYVRDRFISPPVNSNPEPKSPGFRRVHALGRLEPRGTILTISAPSGNEGARIEKLLVVEGQEVQVGELLAILDVAERRQAAVSEAEARRNVAMAGLDQVRAGQKKGEIEAQAALVQRMDAELKLAEKELERSRRLTSKQAITEETLDQKQLAFDRAEIESRRARAQLDSLREVREVDVHLQEMEVAVSTAALVRARADLDAAKVFSQSAGRVLKIHTYPGEKVGDQGILQIGDVAHMQAVAEVYEGDHQHLRVGQQASIRLTGAGDQFTGTVEQIGLLVARKDILSNDPVSDSDARVLEVRVSLDPAEIPKVERLSNARVEVGIEISDAPKSKS
jgi:HlyD family secretion protein